MTTASSYTATTTRRELKEQSKHIATSQVKEGSGSYCVNPYYLEMAGVCGPHCQHPGCWLSNRVDMIEALRRASLARTKLHGKFHYQQSDIRPAVNEDDYDDAESKGGSLPTLKIVNLFGNNEDEDEYEDPIYLPAYFAEKEKSMLFASAAPRSSKILQVPHASPSSSVSQFFLKQRKGEGKHFKKNLACQRNETDLKSQATCVTMQEPERSVSAKARLPYLVWIPSKKSQKKRQKASSVDTITRGMNASKVHTKNITGNDADFGYLATPFNKEGSVKCFSRASHSVKASTCKTQPNRLPPISRSPTEKSRSAKKRSDVTACEDFHLCGDGLLTSLKIHPGIGAPQNTRTSIYTGDQPWETEYYESKEEDKKTDESRKNDVVDKEELETAHDPLPEKANMNKETVGTASLNADGCMEKATKDRKDTPETRQKIFLPRVTLPKAMLKRLPIENHCKNSIPCRQLSNFQMQPVAETDGSTSGKFSGRTEGGSEIVDVLEQARKTAKCLSEEANVPDGPCNTLHASAADYVVDYRGELTSNRELEQFNTPAPTPYSPVGHVAATPLYNGLDAIDVIRQEQEREVTHDSLSEDSQSIGRAPSNASRESKPIGAFGSPFPPCKSSPNDWPSDNDIIRQAYEQYRSFTPFKTPVVGLMDRRLTSIKEASREHTCLIGREKSLVSPRGKKIPIVTQLIPDSFQIESRQIEKGWKRRTRATSQIPLLLRSISVQRNSHVKNISEIKVSTMMPRERNTRREHILLEYFRPKEPSPLSSVPLPSPTERSERGNVSLHEISEAVASSQCSRIEATIIIPGAALNQLSIDTSKPPVVVDDLLGNCADVEKDLGVEETTRSIGRNDFATNGSHIGEKETLGKDLIAATDETESSRPRDSSRVNMKAASLSNASHCDDHDEATEDDGGGGNCNAGHNYRDGHADDRDDVDADRRAAESSDRSGEVDAVNRSWTGPEDKQLLPINEDVDGRCYESIDSVNLEEMRHPSSGTGGASRTNLSRRLVIGSRARNSSAYEGSIDSGSEDTLDVELGLTFLSFSSDLDMSLDLDEVHSLLHDR